MEIVISKRGRVKGTLTRIVKYCETIDDSTSTESLQTRLDKLEDVWSEFMNIQNQMFQYQEDPNFVDQEQETEQFEEKYFSARESLLKAQNKLRSSTSREVNRDIADRIADQQTSFLKRLSGEGSSSAGSADMKLPKLEVPKFSGNYTEWISFRDLFTAAVHNNSRLSDSQRLHYLKGLLTDNAATLLRHIAISDANYSQAWERLNQRYDQRGQIVKSFVKTFLSLPPISGPSALGLRRLADGTDEAIRGLAALGDKAEARDPWIIYLLLEKVDSITRQDWAEETSNDEFPTIQQFLSFLEKRCKALEASQLTSRTLNSSLKQAKPNSSFKSFHSTSLNHCPKCKASHALFQCSKFQCMDAESRRRFVNDNRLCFNCLRDGHHSSSCNSKQSCRRCKRRHHTLVHLEPRSQSPQPRATCSPPHPGTSSTDQSSSTHIDTTELQNDITIDTRSHTQSSLVNTHSLSSSINDLTSLLPTVVGYVVDNSGVRHECRMLLDSGSQVSLVTETYVKRLSLPRRHARIPVTGIASSGAGITKGIAQFQVHSRHNNESISLDAFILGNLTSCLPNAQLAPVAQLNTLQLADPNYHIPRSIDVILGADKLFHILEDGKFRTNANRCIAQLTKFGWVVVGQVSQDRLEACNTCNHLTSLHSELDIDRTLRQFWELEDISHQPPFTAEEEEAEKHFKSTVSRSEDGKYVVELPFKAPSIPLGSTYQSALNRLKSMERRFENNPDLKTAYANFMNEYCQLGHMERVPPEERKDSNAYYLPHHAVLKPDSSTTKLRVVFDGSCKSSSGYSLNEALMIGPSIQRDLFSVCLRFRIYRFVFIADIEKMFRQIWIASDHLNYQRILWRDSPSLPIEHYRLRTVTYGTSCAPFLAVRVLQQLAEDYAVTKPIASKTILNSCYVDDIMTGADTVDELIALKNELFELVRCAGFNLRKWSSNCWPLLSSIPEDQCEFSAVDLNNDDKFVKALGLKWYPSTDSFSFRVSLPLVTAVTKRNILSDASRIFDPLGFLTPVTVAIKILFQELWLCNLDWDDPVPANVADRWLNLRNALNHLALLRIPRYLGDSSADFELHGFSDASEKAFAAVVYCRSRNSAGTFHVSLIAAKSKVAPLKQISLPRLELCGALLLSRLFKTILSSLQIEDIRVCAWTDSQIVLHWLSSIPRRWKTFIANRTSEILSSVPRNCWRHVSSENNPADYASRGVLPSDLLNTPMWWNGPEWLQYDSSSWPSKVVPNFNSFEIDVEERPMSIHSLLFERDSSLLSEVLIKFSTWIKLLRVLAFVQRFIRNLRHPQTQETQALTAQEISTARLLILRHVQQTAFTPELKALRRKQALRSRSQLAKLSPFIDTDGLLRVGGRLQHSDLSYQSKHPIILPKDHVVTKLIAMHFHLKYMHAGPTELLALLRQTYWILGCRNVIRKTVHSCVPCFRQRQNTTFQLMGQLPSSRVKIAKPFTHVGCDYAGPITLRLSRGRNPRFLKGYICLFVCMSSKAVHIELVEDLTSDGFIAALRRFIARRGKCSTIFSDNGTNFKGAHRMLTEMHQLLQSEWHNTLVQDHLSQDGIAWSFNPPSSPHFGGLWEAGVKSVKTHLRRVIGDHVLTYAEMYTVLSQIEALLNSRPLCPINSDDIDALTPFHLLTGHAYTAIPEPDLTLLPQTRLSNWQLLQSMMQGFWKRWHVEYLTSLQQRPKWHTPQPEVSEGDLVLLKEPNLPPSKWVLARVEQKYPAIDGYTRVVKLRTKTGIFTRPIVKIVKLPNQS